MPAITSLRSAIRDPRRLKAAVIKRLQAPAARVTYLHNVRLRRSSRQEVFSLVYDTARWGSRESGSGTGSELRATADIRQYLPEVLSRLGVKSLLDAPCGDWNWMRHIDLPVTDYYGVDIVASVIDDNQRRFGSAHRQFSIADLTSDALPQADVILCRDCLVHVSFQDGALILENFRATGATWLLLSNYPEIRANRNQFTGPQWRRLNFQLPPFNFPEPVDSFPDGGDVDPSRLTLWRVQDLPAIDGR